jgi:flavorubredoxin
MKHSKRIPNGCSLAVVETLFKVMERYQKNYCTPSQEHILRLLAKYHGVVICRSTLNVWLKDLADEHWIKRYRRHYRNEKGQSFFRSTAYYLQQKAINYLNSLVKWARKALRLSRVRFYEQHKSKTNEILSSVQLFTVLHTPYGEEKGRASPT